MPAGDEATPRAEESDEQGEGPTDKRTKKLVGLKIGASQIAAAHVVNNGAPELVQVVREPLEPGVVVGGELRDPEALAEALKRFFERTSCRNGRPARRREQPHRRAHLRDRRHRRPAQLENAIRFRAQEVLPIPLDEAVLDYHVLGDDVREDGTTSKRILLVVAYRELVDRYVPACRRAGSAARRYRPRGVRAAALARRSRRRDAGAGALVAVVGRPRPLDVRRLRRAVCEFTRVLDWGGYALDVAIARELDLTPSEVEAIKRSCRSLARRASRA